MTLVWDNPHRPLPTQSETAESIVAATIGVFDGVHRGHQVLVATAAHGAGRAGGRCAAITFEPTPAEFFDHVHRKPRVASRGLRARLLKEAGADIVIEIAFNTAFAELSGRAFLERLFAIAPGLRTVVVGYDFHLGSGRGLSAQGLGEAVAAWGARVDIVPAQSDNADSISSSRIRRAVATGELEEAERLLGRPYVVDTASGLPNHREACRQLLPPPGRYLCEVEGPDGSREGMMRIEPSGLIGWELPVETTDLVAIRRLADATDHRTKT